MNKLGFAGQWIEIFNSGRHTDNAGTTHDFDEDFLGKVVANFSPSTHEPPAVIGHPREDARAYGWINAVRVNGNALEAQFADTDPAFEEMVRSGRFKKRSASFYLDPAKAPGGQAPALRHVGFLGAQPPAIKGLRQIYFGEGESLTFEFSEGESMDDKDLDKVSEGVTERLKKFLGLGQNGKPEGNAQPASFSEAQVQDLATKAAATAVEAVRTEFAEKVTALETENNALRDSVAAIGAGSKRTEIVAFAERLGKAKFPPAFVAMGAIDFMERIATLPADQKFAVVTFSEDDKGTNVEKTVEVTPLQWFQNFCESMPTFVQFGEHFSKLSASADTAAAIDPQCVAEMRQTMGIKEGK